MSFMIPVTVAGFFPSISSVFPIGSPLPKYFLAAVSDKTILKGVLKTVEAVPLTNGKVNTENKDESA